MWSVYNVLLGPRKELNGNTIKIKYSIKTYKFLIQYYTR